MRYENLWLLRKSEERTKRKSKRDFDAELGFMEASSEVFRTTFEILSKDYYKSFNHREDATYRISYRIFRIVRCAVNSSLEGYYDVTTALLRIAYENHLLMNTFLKMKTKQSCGLKERVSYSNSPAISLFGSK